MRYLLDVNVLVAWGWIGHPDHTRVKRWIDDVKGRKGIVILTSAIPQMGFVRVTSLKAFGQLSPREAGVILQSMLLTLGKCHQFLPDDVESLVWPDWCKRSASTTDAHLLALAQAHGAVLATLDQGIPGAHLIPQL